MRSIVTKLAGLVAIAAASLFLSSATPAAAAVAGPAVSVSDSLLQPVQYYAPGPYYRPRFYGPRFYGRRGYGPGFYGRPGFRGGYGYGRGYRGGRGGYGRGYRR